MTLGGWIIQTRSDGAVKLSRLQHDDCGLETLQVRSHILFRGLINSVGGVVSSRVPRESFPRPRAPRPRCWSMIQAGNPLKFAGCADPFPVITLGLSGDSWRAVRICSLKCVAESMRRGGHLQQDYPRSTICRCPRSSDKDIKIGRMSRTMSELFPRRRAF